MGSIHGDENEKGLLAKQEDRDVEGGKTRKISRVRKESCASNANLSWNFGSRVIDEGTTESPTGRVTWPLAVTAAVSIFGNSFPHGWNTGVLNTPAYLINDFLNRTYTEKIGSEPGLFKLDLLWAASVSVYLIGGCIGAFCAGYFADKFGRKRALLICHIFSYISAALFGFCDMAHSIVMLILARCIAGIGCGAGSGLVPMYLTEIAPVNIRGAMGVLHQFALTCGILFSQVFGLRQILGQEKIWPILLAFNVIPSTVSCLILPWFPESPRYLLVNKGQREEAERALQRFRGRTDVKADMEEMTREYEIQKSEEEWSFKQLFTAKQLRLPLILVCSLAMCQQLSGINVVFYYSTSIFLSAGIPEGSVQYANIGTGAVNVIMTGISVPLMEKCGRRILLLGGMIGMIVAASGLTLALNLQSKVDWMAYISIVCLVLFVVGFAIGLGSIPQFIGAELFKQGPRPPAMSFAGLLNWLCNFIVGITFPSMQSALKEYSFIVFIVIVLGFGIFLWWKLPETKGKTYDQIYAIMGIKDPTKSTEGGLEEKENLREPDEVEIKTFPLTNNCNGFAPASSAAESGSLLKEDNVDDPREDEKQVS